MIATGSISVVLRCEIDHENMERMLDKVADFNYKRYVHFFYVNNWNIQDLNLETMKVTDKILRPQVHKSA